VLWGIQEIPQEHLHTFQLFILAIKTTNLWSQQHFSECMIGWTLKTIRALLNITFRGVFMCLYANSHAILEL